MKKIVTLFFMLVAVGIIVACNGSSQPELNIEEKIDEILQSVSVVPRTTTNLNLPTTTTVHEEARLAWTSSNNGVITNAGVVTRQASDVSVLLRLRVDLLDQYGTRDFTVIVTGTNENNNNNGGGTGPGPTDPTDFIPPIPEGAAAVLDFATIPNTGGNITGSPRITTAEDLVTDDEQSISIFQGRSSNIDTDGNGFVGTPGARGGLVLTANDARRTPTFETNFQIANLSQIIIPLQIWNLAGDRNNFDANVEHLNVSVSQDGVDWTVVVDLAPEIDSTSAEVQTFTVDLEEIGTYYVQIQILTSNTPNSAQTRLTFTHMSFIGDSIHFNDPTLPLRQAASDFVTAFGGATNEEAVAALVEYADDLGINLTNFNTLSSDLQILIITSIQEILIAEFQAEIDQILNLEADVETIEELIVFIQETLQIYYLLEQLSTSLDQLFNKEGNIIIQLVTEERLAELTVKLTYLQNITTSNSLTEVTLANISESLIDLADQLAEAERQLDAYDPNELILVAASMIASAFESSTVEAILPEFILFGAQLGINMDLFMSLPTEIQLLVLEFILENDPFVSSYADLVNQTADVTTVVIPWTNFLEQAIYFEATMIDLDTTSEAWFVGQAGVNLSSLIVLGNINVLSQQLTDLRTTVLADGDTAGFLDDERFADIEDRITRALPQVTARDLANVEMDLTTAGGGTSYGTNNEVRFGTALNTITDTNVTMLRMNTAVPGSSPNTLNTTGLALRPRANNETFENAFIQTNFRVLGLQSISFNVWVWNLAADLNNFNNIVAGIYVQVSLDGLNWTNVAEIMSDVVFSTTPGQNNAGNAISAINVNVPTAGDFYVRIFAQGTNENTTSDSWLQSRIFIGDLNLNS